MRGFVSFGTNCRVFKGYINNCIYEIINKLFELEDKYISWLSHEVQHLESLQNHEHAEFLKIIKKINRTKIFFSYKLGREFFGQHYFNKKKEIRNRSKYN